MFRKNYFNFLLTAALFMMSAGAVFAQTAPVHGKVEIKKADGTTAPAVGVLVEVFRTDQKAKLPSDKTDKKGYFAFAGLPLGARYALVVSGSGISPTIYPNVPAGADNFTITVSEGDGKRFTEDEVRQTLAGGSAATTKTKTDAKTETNTAELTAEQKKQKEEYDKQVQQITQKNKKIEESSAVVQKAVAEGNAAFNAKNYDLAITKFEEGYNAQPEFVGSAPVFLNNKGIALRLRAIDLYNQSVKETDPTVKMDKMNKVTKDFSDAVDSFDASWTLLKNAAPSTVTDPKNYESNKLVALRGLKDVVKYMVATEKVDSAKLPVIKTLMQEYLNVETDNAAKAEGQLYLADAYRVGGDFDSAIIEYRKALEMSPDNPDVLAGLGLSLFAAGEAADDTQKKQEGLNYMQKFTEVAPANHKLKESVASVVEYLKSQKLTPQKTNKKK